MHEGYEQPEMGPALQEPEVTHDETPAPGAVNGALEQIIKEEEEDENRREQIERIKRGPLN